MKMCLFVVVDLQLDSSNAGFPAPAATDSWTQPRQMASARRKKRRRAGGRAAAGTGPRG